MTTAMMAIRISNDGQRLSETHHDQASVIPQPDVLTTPGDQLSRNFSTLVAHFGALSESRIRTNGGTILTSLHIQRSGGRENGRISAHKNDRRSH